MIYLTNGLARAVWDLSSRNDSGIPLELCTFIAK
jgi:hypothetical protein